jgi:hypothetical protein
VEGSRSNPPPSRSVPPAQDTKKEVDPPPGAIASGPSIAPPSTRENLPEDDPDTLVSRSADAKGSFAQTPLVYVLVHALDRRFTGTLVVRDATGAVGLLTLHEGAVARVESDTGTNRLGDLAVEAGLCPPEAASRAATEAARDGTRVGAALVRQTGIAPDTIKRLLKTQVQKRVAALVNLSPETTYTLHLRERSTEPFEPWAPLEVLLAAVRAWGDRPRIHGTMRFLAKQSLRLHPGGDLAGLAETQTERAAIEVMSAGDPTLEVLYRSTGGGLSSLIYVLAVTRQFEFSQKKGPAIGRAGHAERMLPGAVPAIPPPPKAPSNVEGAEPLATPYELEQSSPPVVVKTALDRPITESFVIADTLAGTARPATVAPPAPVPPPQEAQTQAQEQALGQGQGADKRGQPPKAPTSAPSAPASSAADPGSEDHTLAEAALARHDYSAAEHHAARAMHAAPKKPEYAALFAWVCACRGEDGDLPEGVRALTRVLEDHPQCEPALFYRGTLLKRAGKDKAALRDFVTILYQNPQHAGALNEVRILRKGKK